MRIGTRGLLALGWLSALAGVVAVVFLTWWTVTYPELRRTPDEVLAVAMLFLVAHTAWIGWRMVGFTREYRRGELEE